MVQQFASVGLFDPSTDTGAKAKILDEPQSGVLNQLLGVDAILVRDREKLCFLLWREMNFHGSERRDCRSLCQ